MPYSAGGHSRIIDSPSLMKAAISVARAFFTPLRKAHSHTIPIRHPIASKACLLRRSRAVFSANFLCHFSELVAGVVV